MALYVTAVDENSPAEKAGILAGDSIVQVDDIRSNTMELTKLVRLIL